MAKPSASLPRGARAGKKGSRTLARQSPIDFSDLPELSDEQLRTLRRVGRPLLGDHARQLIAIRLDPDVLRQLREEANRRKIGYQTLVNRVLADYVKRSA